ncbi:MAG TPA: hypothetical protein VGP82_17035 [Ktedonobacterales bacterium]|nr:hypothetical protein [Ktedonobacterales bacterium]
MRDTTRHRIAEAKSRRASPDELREAQQRLKEIEEELSQFALLPETKQGEEREARYQRVLRLRAMRAEFQRKVRPIRPDHPNSLLLALVMTVASFLICAFCVGGAYATVRFIGLKPDPNATASAFWSDVQSHNYNDLYTNLLYPTLRAQFAQDTFSTMATNADTTFGPVTQIRMIGVRASSDSTTIIAYEVTRQSSQAKSQYNVTLILTLQAGSWTVSDIGNTFTPVNAGVPEPPTPTPGVTPTVAPTNTVPAG